MFFHVYPPLFFKRFLYSFKYPRINILKGSSDIFQVHKGILIHFYCGLCAETGGICIAPRPAEDDAPILPTMAMRPFFGIQPVLMGETVSCRSQSHTPLTVLSSWVLKLSNLCTSLTPLHCEAEEVKRALGRLLLSLSFH